MNILCIDIGNTHAHWGLLKWPKSRPAEEKAGSRSAIVREGEIPRGWLDAPEFGLPGVLVELRQQGHPIDGVSFCSVVPEATQRLQTVLRYAGLPVFHLTSDDAPGLAIDVPRPREVGQDRLANTIAAQALYGAPTIVIDLGTAVTFDILTDNGYEGGIIAPGLNIMTRYLHEQTALLPSLDPNDLACAEGIGKTTEEAMRLGCAVGFEGMIGALLKRVRKEMKKQGHRDITVVATGGSAGSLPRAWLGPITFRPNLTLRGLAEAYRRASRRKKNVPRPPDGSNRVSPA